MAEPPVLPSWRYHVTGQRRVVTTVEDLEALAPGEWFETPAAAAEASSSAARAQQEEAAPEDESPSPRRSRR